MTEPIVTPPLDGIVERIVIECGRHRVFAAPGMVVFIEGTWHTGRLP